MFLSDLRQDLTLSYTRNVGEISFQLICQHTPALYHMIFTLMIPPRRSTKERRRRTVADYGPRQAVKAYEDLDSVPCSLIPTGRKACGKREISGPVVHIKRWVSRWVYVADHCDRGFEKRVHMIFRRGA